MAVDVGEDVGATGLGAERHAIVIGDRGAIRAIFQVADIAGGDARAAGGAGFLDAGVIPVVLVAFAGCAAGDLGRLVFGVPGVAPPAIN